MKQDLNKAKSTPNPSTNEGGFQCPLCSAKYSNEILTRVHISRADDEVHQNHTGFHPDTKIEAVEPDGTVIDNRTAHPADINVNSLGPEELPDEFDEAKKRVLLVAAYHPDIESFSDLHDLANAALKEHGIDSVSQDTVRRWTQEFYAPTQNDSVPSETEMSGESNGPDLGDCTLKQQGILVAKLSNPELANTKIADLVDCSVPYVGKVLREKEDLYEKYSGRIDSGESIIDIVNSELDPEQRKKMTDSGILGTLGVEIDSNQTESAGIDMDGFTDGPVTSTDSRIMSASPHESMDSKDDDAIASLGSESGVSSSEDIPSSQKSEIAQSSVEEPVEESVTGGVRRGSDASCTDSGEVTDISPEGPRGEASARAKVDSGTIPASDLYDVLKHVRFVRRVLEREAAEPVNGSQERIQGQLAVVHELESELEGLL